MARGRKTRIALGSMLQSMRGVEDRAEEIVDMRRDPEGYWATVPGQLQVIDLTGTPPTSLHWFVQRPGQRHLVAEVAIDQETSEIHRVNLHTGNTTSVATRRRLGGADAGTHFVQNGRWLYMFSPLDAPIRWDTNQIMPVGFPAPAASPTVWGPDQGATALDMASRDFSGLPGDLTSTRGVGPHATIGTGVELPWRYGYAVQWVNDLGQISPPSPIVYASGINFAVLGSRMLARLKFEQAPPNVRGVILWRTMNLIHGDPLITRGLTLYRHSSWPTGAGFDLWDHTPDEELGPDALDADQYGPMPQGIRAAAFWEGGLWVGGGIDDPTRLHYSYPGSPEQFPAVFFLAVGSHSTGPIVAIKATQKGLVVFKSRGVYLVRGSYSAGFRVTAIDEQRGCAAPRALELVPQANAIPFLDRSGPYLLQLGSRDEAARVVSLDGARKLWRQEVGSDLAASCVVHDPEHHEVWFQVPTGGNVVPSLGLVYHYDDGGFSIRRDWWVLSMAYGYGRIWTGTWASGGQGINVLSKAATLKLDAETDEALGGSYLTSVTESDERRAAFRLNVAAVATGPASGFTVTTELDRSGDELTQTEAIREAKHPDKDRPVWGTAVWGTAYTWSDYDPAWVPVSIRDGTGWEHQWRITAAASTGPARMRLMDLQVVTDEHAHTTERTQR